MGEGAERIRRREVSRALARMDLPPKEEKAVERMSRSIVDRLLRGPIPRALAHAEGGASGSPRRDARGPKGG